MLQNGFTWSENTDRVLRQEQIFNFVVKFFAWIKIEKNLFLRIGKTSVI
jgi:hypothetical protein